MHDFMFDTADPFALFEAWFDEARNHEPNDPDAMALATVDGEGLPDVRMVLLKAHGPQGFVFYTNDHSAKGVELKGQPKAALCLHWKSLRRQVRVRGAVERVLRRDVRRLFHEPRSRQPLQRHGVRAVAPAAKPRGAAGAGRGPEGAVCGR